MARASRAWTGAGWTLAQWLRRYAAWAVELLIGGALAAAVLTAVTQLTSPGPDPGGAVLLDATASAALWLATTAVLVAMLHPRDPLRHSSSWAEAAGAARSLARAHPVAIAAALILLMVGTVDLAGAATPVAVQQLIGLVPELAVVNVCAFGAAVALSTAIRRATGGWTDPQHALVISRWLSVGAAGPLAFALCLVVEVSTGHQGPSPARLVFASAAAVFAGGLLAMVDRRLWPRRPVAWMGAVVGGVLAGLASSGGIDQVVIGAVLGGSAGAGLVVGTRFAHSQATLWRHRDELPLPSGEVVYWVDGRSMEITLETGDRDQQEQNLRRDGDGFLTEDGWRVAQLTPACWEGSKGRAQLLGRRRDDLLGVIRILHPEAPGAAPTAARVPASSGPAELG